MALLAAGAWLLVAVDTGYVSLAGWLSFAWAASVVGIAIVVGLRRRPVVGVLGILAGIWVAVFATGVATRPMAQASDQFGNLWFTMGSVGILVAGLSGVSSSPPLRWFGRVLAIGWVIGAIVSIGGEQFTVPVGALGEAGLRRVAIQWAGLAAFGVWALWSARWLARDMSLDWSHPPYVDVASDAEARRAWSPYGRWPRWLARSAAVLAILTVVPLALDRFAGIADLATYGFEIGLGLVLAACVFVIGRSTPRLGHSRFDLFSAVPHLGLLFGFTETGVIAALAFAGDGTLEGVFDGRRTDLMVLFPPALLGLWIIRAAFRQRVGPRQLGLIAGGGLLVSGLVGTVMGEAGLPVILPGLVLSGFLALSGAWLWGLASVMVPGVALPAMVFDLPGLGTGYTPPPAPVARTVAPRPVEPPRIAEPVTARIVAFGALSPTRYGITALAARIGSTVEELRAAQPTYRRVAVPKRSGGTRVLFVPDAATKALQRRLLRSVIGRARVHPAAHGFERGRSIVSNAAPHARRAVVVRMDVIDFFGSTSARRVRRLFRVLGWDAETAELLTRLTTHEGGLPTGAPTSPRLANLVNVLLDARLAGLADALGARYTRYADDLTFSFERDDHAALADLLGATRRIARAHGYRLHVERKLQIRRRHHRQTVTGLVVNDRVALPRQRRRWLRAVEHHVYSGQEASLTREQLTGWQAFESMVEVATEPPRA
jgi:hypothetical protein